MEQQCIAGNHFLTELHIVYLHEVCGIALGILNGAENKQTACLSHGFHQQNAGHHGFLGEVPLEEGFVDSNVLYTYDVGLALVNNFVDQPVSKGFLRRHVVVALRIGGNLCKGFSRILGKNAGQPLFGFLHLFGHDLNIRDRAVYAVPSDQRLVDHDLSVGQSEALALGAAGQQECAH